MTSVIYQNNLSDKEKTNSQVDRSDFPENVENEPKRVFVLHVVEWSLYLS